mgnify:CR=1 FL=1
MNAVQPSGKGFFSWFTADNLFTWVITIFLLVVLTVFLLYPVVDICRLSFIRDGFLPCRTISIFLPNPGYTNPFTTACMSPL